MLVCKLNEILTTHLGIFKNKTKNVILKLLSNLKTSGISEIILNKNIWETYLLKMSVCSTAAVIKMCVIIKMIIKYMKEHN